MFEAAAFVVAILGCADLAPLWSGGNLTKAAGSRAIKDMRAALSALDEEGSWSVSLSGNTIEAQRVEDGIVQAWSLSPEDLGNWRVARVRAACGEAGLFDAAFAVGGARVYGPLGLMSRLRTVGSKGAQVSRYKGLGEMNPTELWETTLNPQVRALHRVDLLDAQAAESIFSDLMADDVAARRALIEKMCAGATRVDL